MSSLSKIVLSALIVVSLVSGLISCGAGGTNNNQGRSFRANAFCAVVDGTISADCDPRTSFDVVPLSSTVFGGLSPLDGQSVVVGIQFQNFLTEQFIRVDRIDCSYEIPGADAGLFIPDDSFGVGRIIEGTNTDGGTGNTEVFGFEIITPDFFAFLNANRSSLPLLPFRAIAICSGTGVTSGGDTLTSNSINFTVQFGEESEGQGVIPGGVFDTGPGTGGDLATTDSTGDTGGVTEGLTDEADMAMEDLG